MKALWWTLIGLSLLALVGVWWSWHGVCTGDPANIECELEPRVTWPVAIGVSAVAVLVLLGSLFMALKDKVDTPTYEPT